MNFIIKRKTISLFFILSLLSLNLSAKDGDPDISDKERLIAVEKKLKENPNHNLIYVQGLVCSSCGIGVKVQLRKLKGIDKKQLDKGVNLDINTQLAAFALLDNHTALPQDVLKAITKAGYEAKYLYQWDGKAIVKTKLQ